MMDPAHLNIPTYDDMLAAHERIKPHIRRTDIRRSDYLNELTGADLFFKCENLQEAGAFKVRGACNAVFGLSEDMAGADDVDIAVVSGHAGRTILDFAGEQGIDCIVMNSHRPDLTDYFLGSTAARVVRHARCAVHVLR